jgi:two-component system, sensor histidine kinase and response regulator
VPDLLLIDEDLPGIDGVMLARLLMSDAQFAGVPRILVGREGAAVVSDAQALGFSARIEKPLRQGRFLEALHVAMRRAPQAPAALPVAASYQRLGAVLVAEDNAINQRVISVMLKPYVERVVIAANGTEAVARYQQGTWDCVLMDCQMPEMDGFEATRRIRQIEQDTHQRHVPIIALTANALPGDREQCLAVGMDDYLSKPLRAADLENALGRLLINRPAEAADAMAATAIAMFLRMKEMLGIDTLRTVLDLGIADLPRMLDEAHGAWTAGDAVRLGRIVHAVKGTAAALDLDDLRGACVALEKRIKAGEHHHSSQEMTRWEAAIRESVVLLGKVQCQGQ